jgi:hypothetical protein
MCYCDVVYNYKNKNNEELGITKFLDFVHRPVFYETREHNVSETGSVSVLRSGEERT